MRTTGIGSLPHEDIEEAVEYSLRHDIPFLPELTALKETMFEYIEKPGQLICLNRWKEEVEKQEIRTVKIQCIGPVTLIQNGYDKKDAMAIIYHHISPIVDLNVGEIKLFSDEPSLHRVKFDFDLRGCYEEWLEMINLIGENIQTPIVTGIHSCGDLTDQVELRRFDCLFESKIDTLSVDASKYDITKYPAYRGNKRIAWGVDFGEDKRFKSEEALIKYLRKHFQKGDLLTLPCGMSHKVYNVEDCKENLEMLLRVSEEVYSSRGSN